MLEIRDTKEFTRWINTAQRGSRVVYHKCRDDNGAGQLLARRERNKGLDDLATLAWHSYTHGQANLVQKRENGRLLYLAEKR